jgi:pyruvate-formate lyase-activating enzyme
MDYIDKVNVDLKGRQPGCYPIHNFRERERFTEAVKELIDEEWLMDVYFSQDYRTLVISEPFIQGDRRFTARGEGKSGKNDK